MNTQPLFSTHYHIYINHTDAGGIVYHANHLVFFENCRRDWFTKLSLGGYFLQTDSGDIQHFVVSQAQLQYRRAILLDEVVEVRIDKVELKPASIIFYQSIHRQLPVDPTLTNSNDSSTTKSSTDTFNTQVVRRAYLKALFYLSVMSLRRLYSPKLGLDRSQHRSMKSISIWSWPYRFIISLPLC